MRIEKFWNESRGDTLRVTADVVWEDRPRGPISVYFETDSRFCGDIDKIRSAFLLAGAVPALFQEERRIQVEGSLDPVLREGLETALAILQNWHGLVRAPLSIEPTAGYRALESAPDRAALFLTGGVDSLHLLRMNRKWYPREHVASFRSAITIADFAFPMAEDSPRSRDVNARQTSAVEAICRAEGLESITVRTNMRWIEPEIFFTTRAALGACLAAAAHFVAGSISTASMASGLQIASLVANGSHPLLDPNFSGSALEIRHDGVGRTRLEKVEMIADWETARDNLSVCFEGPLSDGTRNCGKCEKCVRTMASLVLFDSLRQTGAFQADDVTAEMIDHVELGYHPEDFPYFWASTGEALRRVGRSDLSRAVRRRVAAAERYPKWLAEKGSRELVRRWDRRLLNGAIEKRSRRRRASGEWTPA